MAMARASLGWLAKPGNLERSSLSLVERKPLDSRHLSRLASQVKRYIEKVLPQLERSGGFPDLPMDRAAKGESNPPVGDMAMLLWWVNRDVGKILNPLLAEMYKGHDFYGPYAFSDLLEFATYDSGAFVRWLSQNPAGRDAFWSMCMQVAMVAMARHGKDIELHVITSPEIDEAFGEVADPRRVPPKWRTITAHDAYYSIVARLERIRTQHPGITEAAAEVECQKELEAQGLSGSIGRIRDAKTFVNAQRRMGVA